MKGETSEDDPRRKARPAGIHARGNYVNKFTMPDPVKPLTTASYSLPVDMLDHVKKIAADQNVSPSSVIRQMIHHCLADLGINCSPGPVAKRRKSC